MPKPTREHAQLEADVKAYAEKLGFIVPRSLTYHDVMPEDEEKLLRGCYDPTSIIVRTRADRLAVNPHTRTSFKWEAKTHGPSKSQNMAIEAIPLAMHITSARMFGTRCLYAYRDDKRGLEAGFWVDETPLPEKLWIPDNTRYDEARERASAVLGYAFPKVPHQRCEFKRGSGAPFVVIAIEEVEKLPSWRDILKGEAR